MAGRITTLIHRDAPRTTRILRCTLFQLPIPVSLARVDAEQLIPATYDGLKPHALYRLTLQEGQPDHERQLLTYQLEVVCDTGTASTPPLALSSWALMALQRQAFRMPGPEVVRLEQWEGPA